MFCDCIPTLQFYAWLRLRQKVLGGKISMRDSVCNTCVNMSVDFLHTIETLIDNIYVFASPVSLKTSDHMCDCRVHSMHNRCQEGTFLLGGQLGQSLNRAHRNDQHLAKGGAVLDTIHLRCRYS